MNRFIRLSQQMPLLLTLSVALSLIVLLSITVYEVSELQRPQPQSLKPSPKIHTLKLGHNTPDNTALHAAAQRFAKQVEAESHGRLKIELFPAQQLGNDHQMIEMTREGELDILLVPTAKLSVPIPAMQYADLPFLFPTREDAYRLLDGEPGRLLLEKLKSIGLLGVTFWENGFKHFTGHQFFTTPEDFVDKKFRIMKSRLIESQFNALGAEAIPIDFHSTYQALKDGVVDGQENPLVAIASMGFHKVQSHLTLSEHGYLSYVFAFSQNTFSKLPQDLKALLIEAAHDQTDWERQETQRRETAFLTKIKDAGVQVRRLTRQQRQVLAAKTAHLIQQFEPIIGSNIISYTQTDLNQKYAFSDNTPKIAIGLNTDLSSEAKQAGLAIKRGMELAIADLNAQGGLLGQEVVLLPMDHRALSSRGQQNIEKLALQKHLIAIMGGVHSAVIMAERPLIHRLKMPYLVPWATATEITKADGQHQFLFRVSINDAIGAKKLADFTVQHHQKPAIIVENSVWGRSNLQRLKAFLTEKAIPPVLEFTFNRGQRDFDALIELIKQVDADSIILVANAQEAAALVKRLHQKQRLLPIISHWGIAAGNFFEEVSPFLSELNLHLLQTYSFFEPHNATKHHLYQRYLEVYQTLDIPYAANGVAQAYDLVHLLALAVEQQQSTDPEAIQQAMEQPPPYQGVLKDYAPAFSADSHDALTEEDIYIAKVTPKGQLLAVAPQETP